MKQTLSTWALRAILLVGTTFSALGCASHRTVLIPRYTQAVAPTEEFSAAFFEAEQTVRDNAYRLLAVAYGETLHLGARFEQGFAGAVVWHAGELQLKIVVPATQDAETLPVFVEGSPGTPSDQGDSLTARVRRAGTTTTIVVELPHVTLRNGDGTLTLEFVRPGQPPIVIPAEGRLRGVYLQS